MASMRAQLESIENKLNFFNVSAPVPAVTSPTLLASSKYNSMPPPGFNPPPIPGQDFKPIKPVTGPLNFKNELEMMVAKRREKIKD